MSLMSTYEIPEDNRRQYNEETLTIYGNIKCRDGYAATGEIRINHPSGGGYKWCLYSCGGYKYFGDDKFSIERIKTYSDGTFLLYILQSFRFGEINFEVDESSKKDVPKFYKRLGFEAIFANYKPEPIRLSYKETNANDTYDDEIYCDNYLIGLVVCIIGVVITVLCI